MRIEGVYVRLTVVDEHIDASSLVSQGVDEIDDVLVLRHVKIVGLCHPALGSDLRHRLLGSRLYASSRNSAANIEREAVHGMRDSLTRLISVTMICQPCSSARETDRA